MTLDRRSAPQWHLLLAPQNRAAWPRLHLSATASDVAREADGVVYLATPYSREVVEAGRFNIGRSVEMQIRAERAGARLAAYGVTAISPIALSAGMCHQTTQLDPLDHKFWMRWCAPLLAVSTAVVVPDIPGWDKSQGIWTEVVTALDRGLPVFVYAGADEVAV